MLATWHLNPERGGKTPIQTNSTATRSPFPTDLKGFSVQIFWWDHPEGVPSASITLIPSLCLWGRGIFPDSILCFLTHNSPPISQIFNNFQVMISSSHLLYLAFCVFCFWVVLIWGCSVYFLCVCVCLWGGFSLFLCDFLSVCWWVLVIWFVGGFWSYHF